MKRIFFAALGALLSFSAWASSGYSPPDPLAFPRLDDRWYVKEDFGSLLPDGDFFSTANGTGAAFALDTPWDTNVYGQVEFQLGTIGTNYLSWRTSDTALKLGGGPARMRARVLIQQVSNTVDTYTSRYGFIDSGSVESTDGVFFRTSAATPFRFYCVTRAAGVETATDTFVTVTVAFDYRLRIEINAAATEVLFYVNTVLVCTHTTNIPTAELGVGVMALRSLGTAALNPISMDYIEAEAIPTVRR